MSVLVTSAAVTSAAASPAADRRPAEAARGIRAAEARRRPAGRRRPVDRPPQRRRVHQRQRRRQRPPSRDRPSSSRRANQDRRRATPDRRPNRLRSGRRSAWRSSGPAHRTAEPPRRNQWTSLHLQPASPRPREEVHISSFGVPPLLRPQNGMTEALELRLNLISLSPMFCNTVAKFRDREIGHPWRGTAKAGRC